MEPQHQRQQRRQHRAHGQGEQRRLQEAGGTVRAWRPRHRVKHFKKHTDVRPPWRGGVQRREAREHHGGSEALTRFRAEQRYRPDVWEETLTIWTEPEGERERERERERQYITEQDSVTRPPSSTPPSHRHTGSEGGAATPRRGMEERRRTTMESQDKGYRGQCEHMSIRDQAPGR
ncbi:hypothetical protein EYF80_013477 [Liparis tanakae]|uniref:Uncharacterized protein n=1 Tax=Liparis tanakae TaxID=230148 RepID=A0A4Z2IDN2_9TELE|nr:hypothetical protein EYF80_013477 [Liparis tanakae]